MHAVVEAGRPVQKDLVKDFGRTGLAPDSMIARHPAVEFRMKPNGTPRIVYDRNHPVGLGMRAALSFDEIVFQRQIYLVWWEEMARVAEFFKDNLQELTSFCVSGVEAARAPWGHGDWVAAMASRRGVDFAKKR